MTRCVTLVGMMGAGKSTLAKTLASRWQVPWFDLDELVVERAGMSIPEIFEVEGDAGFRRYERAVLEATLAKAPSLEGVVIATGGGAPAQPGAMALIGNASTPIYLRCPPALLAERTWAPDDVSRPLLADCATVDGAAAKLAALLEEREQYYLRAAVVVDVGAEDDVEAVVRKVEAALAELENPG